MRQNEGHWLWGQFTEKDTNYLNSLKNKVQSELKSPIFDIHITLTGPYKIINEQFLNSLRSFAKQNSSIDLKLKQFEYTDDFYKSFYILIEELNNLKNLRLKLSKLNPNYYPYEIYKPHISLTYGDHDLLTKKNIISKLKLFHKQITLNRVSLVSVNEKKKIWEIIQSFNLLG